jgi:phage terminase small subunit
MPGSYSVTPVAQLIPGITRCSDSTSAVKEIGTLPVLKNPRHERFCQELAKGKSATEAYGAAGYKGNRRNASHLATKSDIKRRLEELQSEIAARVVEQTAVTRAEILEELKKIAFATFEDGSVKANDKRAACMDYARIEGWIVERHEHGSAGEFADYEAMSPDERKRAAADIAKRLSEAGVFDGADRRGRAKD